MSIPKNLKSLREKHGLSQKDIALIAGVSEQAVSSWETGVREPRMGPIQKIADHFGILKSDIIEEHSNIIRNSSVSRLDGETLHLLTKLAVNRNAVQRELKLEIIKDVVLLECSDEQLRALSAFLKTMK